jgi:hypothetical protein
MYLGLTLSASKLHGLCITRFSGNPLGFWENLIYIYFKIAQKIFMDKSAPNINRLI